MDKDIKYLIIPDLHGRGFWKDPVQQALDQTDCHIVFLGDYHDPYPREFDDDDWGYLRRSVDQLMEIIELKRQNPERITLLLGNHDCGYAIDDGICSSRMDKSHRRELEELFQENRELFQLAKSVDLAGRHIIFSHAGIHKGWADLVWGESCNDPTFDVVDALNQAWTSANFGILQSLGDYDNFRGWGGYEYGSPVWSDIRSWVRVTPEESFGFHIVGHTQTEADPVILGTIVDLDCRKAFYLDSSGDIREWDTDTVLTKTREE